MRCKHPRKLVRDMVGRDHAPWDVKPTDKAYMYTLEYPKHSRRHIAGGRGVVDNIIQDDDE